MKSCFVHLGWAIKSLPKPNLSYSVKVDSSEVEAFCGYASQYT